MKEDPLVLSCTTSPVDTNRGDPACKEKDPCLNTKSNLELTSFKRPAVTERTSLRLAAEGKTVLFHAGFVRDMHVPHA